jgi:ribose transport system permease protein
MLNSLRERTRRDFSLRKAPTVLWVVAILAVFFTLTCRSSFCSTGNFLNIAVQGSVLMILAVGATCAVLTAGTDLSLGSMLTLSGVIAVLTMQRGLPAIPAMLCGIGSGVLCGALNGFLIARAKLPPFIATLGTQGIAGGTAVVLTNAQAIYHEAPEFLFLGSGRLWFLPMPVVSAIIVFAAVYVILYHTSFGHYIFALGGNEAGTTLSGVNTVFWKFMTYVLVGCLGGIAGVVMAARLRAADPTVGVGWEFDAIAATILGGTSFQIGKGGIVGTVIGVALIALLRNGLNVLGMLPSWQALTIGVVIILAIIFDTALGRGREEW